MAQTTATIAKRQLEQQRQMQLEQTQQERGETFCLHRRTEVPQRQDQPRQERPPLPPQAAVDQ